MRIDLNLKEGVCGPWEVSKFTISQEDANRSLLRCMLNSEIGRELLPGEYWRLTCNGKTVMSNTPAEINDHIGFIHEAHGCVLIVGLGLGMVLQEILKKQDVTKVTVVEISEEVIELVGCCYSDNRLEIVNADINMFVPSCKYDYGWYDIWNYIDADNVPEMNRIKKRLAPYVGKQACWCESECKMRLAKKYV